MNVQEWGCFSICRRADFGMTSHGQCPRGGACVVNVLSAPVSILDSRLVSQYK